MSLVNEALRKARQDAARRDAESRGSLPLATPMHMPATSRSPLLSPVVIVLGVLLVLSILLLVALLARPGRGDATSAASTSATKVPTPVVETEVGESESQPSELSVGAVQAEVAREPKAASSSPATAGAGSRDDGRDKQEEAPREAVLTAQVPRQAAAPPDSASALPPPAKTVSTPPAPAEAADQPEAMRQTYRKRVELPDGTEIQLDFIVWSERNPFAQLNGQLARPGEEVGELGYRVLEIDRKGVRLEGPAGTFVIRLQ